MCHGAPPELASPTFFATLASVINMTSNPNSTGPASCLFSAPKVRFSHSPGRSLRSPGSSVPESRALKVRPKNPNQHSTYARADRTFAQVPSQEATTGGPLKTTGPLSSLSDSIFCPTALLLNSLTLGETLVIPSKTKGTQGLMSPSDFFLEPL